LSEKLGLGLNLRYINSRLADNSAASDYKSGSAVSADLSMYYMTTKGWSFGAAFSNLGSKISYGSSGEKSYIPANIGLGAAYTKEINDENKISFGLDLNKLLVPTPPDPANASKVASYNNKSVIGSWFSSYGDAPGGFKEEIQEVQVGIGAEYRYINREYLKNQFFLRAGYFMESKFKGDRNYVTAGVGVKRNMLGLNFSYLATTGSSANNVNALNNTLRFSLLCDFKN
jgi:hypothetical protein